MKQSDVNGFVLCALARFLLLLARYYLALELYYQLLYNLKIVAIKGTTHVRHMEYKYCLSVHIEIIKPTLFRRHRTSTNTILTNGTYSSVS